MFVGNLPGECQTFELSFPDDVTEELDLSLFQVAFVWQAVTCCVTVILSSFLACAVLVFISSPVIRSYITKDPRYLNN